VTAALALLDEQGLSAMTMRRLAASLDVEAASLYAHIGSKDDLVDAMLDRVLDTVELPAPGPDARTFLVAAFGNYRVTLLRHPAVVQLMTERSRLSNAQVRLAARSIDLLQSDGQSLRAAVDTHVTLVAFTLGFILQEVSRPTTTTSTPADLDQRIAPVLRTLAERSVDERFEVGLHLILDGAGVARSRRS
jgi:TetR/AcrR family transcriptional regulator, tetracycline repressor protein